MTRTTSHHKFKQFEKLKCTTSTRKEKKHGEMLMILNIIGQHSSEFIGKLRTNKETIEIRLRRWCE